MKIERPEPVQAMPEDAKLVFQGTIFDVYQWEQEMYDGSVAIFEKLKRPDTVIIFPVLDNSNILLTKQEQPGLKPFIGAAGGQVDRGEEILDAARRELLEETGCVAKEFILWKASQNHRKIDWAVFVFIAKGIERVSDLHLDPGEKIEPHEVSFDDFIEMTAKGETADREIRMMALEAYLDPVKKEELKKLFSL